MNGPQVTKKFQNMRGIERARQNATATSRPTAPKTTAGSGPTGSTLTGPSSRPAPIAAKTSPITQKDPPQGRQPHDPVLQCLPVQPPLPSPKLQPEPTERVMLDVIQIRSQIINRTKCEQSGQRQMLHKRDAYSVRQFTRSRYAYCLTHHWKFQ